jgi:hypothetical protein
VPFTSRIISRAPNKRNMALPLSIPMQRSKNNSGKSTPQESCQQFSIEETDCYCEAFQCREVNNPGKKNHD